MTETLKPQTRIRKQRRNAKPLALSDVDEFLASWVARNYLAFSDSNVKRRILKMLQFLRMEVDRLNEELASYRHEEPDRSWTERMRK